MSNLLPIRPVNFASGRGRISDSGAGCWRSASLACAVFFGCFDVSLFGVIVCSPAYWPANASGYGGSSRPRHTVANPRTTPSVAGELSGKSRSAGDRAQERARRVPGSLRQAYEQVSAGLLPVGSMPFRYGPDGSKPVVDPSDRWTRGVGTRHRVGY